MFDLLDFHSRHKDYYGDAPLEDVAKDVFTRGYADKYPDYDTWKKSSGVESVIQADTRRRNPTFEDKLRGATAEVDPERSSFLERAIKDPLVSAVKGTLVGLPEAVVGLADIPTMGLVGKGVDAVLRSTVGGGFKEANEYFDEMLTPETQAAKKKVEETEGFLPTIQAALENPSSIVASIAESVPSMIGGAGAGRLALNAIGKGVMGKEALMAATKGLTKEAAEEVIKKNTKRAIAAGAVGEGLVSAGQNTEQLRQGTEDGYLTPAQVAIMAGSGALTGVISRMSGGLSKRLGITDVDTLLQGVDTASKRKGVTGILKNVLEAAITEGAFEELPQSAQEQMAQNLATGKPAMEGVAEAGAMGLLAGAGMGIMGAGVSSFQHKSDKPETHDSLLKKLQDRTYYNDVIDTGLKTGKFQEHNFTPDVAIGLIRKAHEEGVYDQDHIEQFKEKYPQLKEPLNALLVDDIKAQITRVSFNGDEADASINRFLGDKQSKMRAEQDQLVGMGVPPDIGATFEPNQEYLDRETAKRSYAELHQPFVDATPDELASIFGRQADRVERSSSPVAEVPAGNIVQPGATSQEITDGKEKSGFTHTTIARDYLLTGGQGAMEGMDYLFNALGGSFSSAENKIWEVANKHSKEIADKGLSNIRDIVGTDLYNRIIADVKGAIDQSYGNNKEEAQKIFDEILKYPTGVPHKVGMTINNRLDQLEELMASNTSQPTDIKARVENVFLPDQDNEPSLHVKSANGNEYLFEMMGTDKNGEPKWKVSQKQEDGKYVDGNLSIDAQKEFGSVKKLLSNLVGDNESIRALEALSEETGKDGSAYVRAIYNAKYLSKYSKEGTDQQKKQKEYAGQPQYGLNDISPEKFKEYEKRADALWKKTNTSQPIDIKAAGTGGKRGPIETPVDAPKPPADSIPGKVEPNTPPAPLSQTDAATVGNADDAKIGGSLSDLPSAETVTAPSEKAGTANPSPDSSASPDLQGTDKIQGTGPAKTAAEAKERIAGIGQRYGDTRRDENGDFRKDIAAYTKARDKEIADALGYTKPSESKSGSDYYRPTIETIHLPRFKNSGSRNASIKLGKHPNGMYAFGNDMFLSQSGGGSPVTIFNELYDSREEALKAAIKELRQTLEKDSSKGNAGDKEYAKKISNELDALAAKNKIVEDQPKEIKAAGTGGKRGPTSKVEEPKTEEKEEPKPDAESYVPHDGWETHLIKAREYAIALGIPLKTKAEKDYPSISKTLEHLVREIKETEHYNKLAGVEEPKADIQKEISDISDKDLDAMIDEKAEERNPTVEDNMDLAVMGSLDRSVELGKRFPDMTVTERMKLSVKIQEAATGTKGEDIVNHPKQPSNVPQNWKENNDKNERIKKSEAKKAKAPKAEKPVKTVDEIISAISKEGVEGVGESIKGLYELFGGASLKSFPGSMNDETYAKAKPHFESALDHFIKVGKGLHEFAATIIKQFGDNIRPYLKRFVQEKRDALKAASVAKKKAAEEKKAKKAAMGNFQNIGYVYDPEKIDGKIKNKPPKTAARIIIDSMVPSKVWAINHPEGTSPGTIRLAASMQGYIKTFKDYLLGDYNRLQKYDHRSRTNMDTVIDKWMAQGGSIDQLKEWAAAYGNAIQPFVDAFKGATSITSVIGRIQDTMLAEAKQEDGTFPELMPIMHTPVFATAREFSAKFRISHLYEFLTKGWQVLLDAEADTLLSEINVHKRGRNKNVVRTGLPNYRENIALKTTDDFNAPFGFKGVGFGEEGWINQEERNRVIPAAYDAFKDLAATIGAPDKGMSLGKELAVQFANLGHKAHGAAAAYFPKVRTMNFTRDNGDGCFAHEWGHSLHDLAYGDAIKEINSIVNALEYVYDFEAGKRMVDDLLAKDSPFLKRMLANKKQQRIEAVKDAARDKFEGTVKKMTDYYSTAQKMDADYTARGQEMWARAFEAFVFDTMGGTNNYLVSDFVAAGRVGGKSGVGTKLVYPAGKEREVFNDIIKHFTEGLSWDETGRPSLKEGYESTTARNQKLLASELEKLLASVEERYRAIWASEPSKDGYYWYRYDETSFGPMMQPDGYAGYDKSYKSEDQNGSGAVAYLTELHPDDILDYKISNFQYEGENPTYITQKGGGLDDSIQGDGTEALDEVSAENDRRPKEAGDIREGNDGSGDDGERGTREASKERDATSSGEGDSDEGIHTAPAGNYFITDPTLNDPKSTEIRFRQNLAAIKLLKQLESEGRAASPGTISIGEAPPGGWTEADKVPGAMEESINEKEILAGYTGWGGMAELFAYSPSKAWQGRSDLIKAELTDEEQRGAASSSTSAYYTPVPVGQFMWKLAERLGFDRGLVLDPATGANGLFFGTMPSNLRQAGVTMQGIEMDGLSARIASKLYELAAIENKSFQDAKKPVNRYDLAITNVPFEDIKPSDPKHNKGKHTLHNYYINKMIDLTAPGALTIAITTSNTLDSGGAHLAEYAKKAELVGAIRLPSSIYNATNVVTDILVFRKNIEGSKFKGIPVEQWTTAGKDESTGLTVNNYFLAHPDMVAGKLEKVSGRFGQDSMRVIGEGDLTSNLERIAAAFPGNIVEREAVEELKTLDDIISAPGTVKEGGLYINDKGAVCLKADGEEIIFPTTTPAERKQAEIAKGFIQILDHVRTVLRSQKTNEDDAAIKAKQTQLKKAYDAFVKKYGPVNAKANAAVYNDVTDAAWVMALEDYDPDTGKVKGLADVFTKNITGIIHKPTHAETDHDALAMSLDQFGYPNLEYMAKLRGSDIDSVLKGVTDKIVEDPETGFLVTMDEYLSGNVKRKLDVARDMAASNPDYERNVKLLESAQPPEIPAHRITARIGASWLRPEHLSEFIKDKLNLNDNKLRVLFNFNPISNEWSMSYRGRQSWKGEVKAETQRQIHYAKNSVEATKMWGTDRKNFLDLVECAINGQRPVVTYKVDGKTFMDPVATQSAEAKLQDIQSHFNFWLFSDAMRAEEAVKRFNEIINTSVPPKADGSHLTFPGKSMAMLTPREKAALGVTDLMTFYPHQMNAVWKYLRGGNLYLAHEVGAGKTATMALIAMEAKRLRGKKKVLYVTLNDSTMGQAVAEIKNIYPLANVLPVRVSTKDQRARRQLQKIALNDFDIAIMRQTDLDRIALSPEAERIFIEEELNEHRELLESLKASGESKLLERDIQEAIHALEEKLKAPSVHEEAKRQNVCFDDLGIDLMIVDEAHSYKNVPYMTRLTRITGLNPPGSPTAKAFFRKTQYLNAQFPKRDGIVLASGTSLSNSIAELYNIQRMLQPQDVKKQGTWSFDRWIANYGDMGTQLEFDGARGEYKSITTNRRIVNAGRLLAMCYQNIDSVRAKDTPIRRPAIRGGEPQRVKIKPNQYVEDYKGVIIERCNAIDRDPKNAKYDDIPDNMLRIISNMSQVAIDQRLLTSKEETGEVDARGKKKYRIVPGPYANTPMQQDSKIYVASRKIYERWKEEAKHKGVQLVFADLGIPKRYADNLYYEDGKPFKILTEDKLAALSVERQEEYAELLREHESGAEGHFNVYDGMKEELVKLGIPAGQIAFIQDADHANKDTKAANLRKLFKRVNAGEVRILIGSTKKAGTGVNIQQRVSDVHHLDVWWNYSEWEQRNGRAIRAGNIYTDLEGVYIHNYVTETTVDATRWDKVFAKGKVLNAVFGADINLDIIEDISENTMSAKLMAADASGNPLMARHAGLMQEVQNLRYEHAGYLDNIRQSKMELAQIPERIKTNENNIADYQRSRAVMEKVTAVRFMGDDRTLVLEKHGKEISEALQKAIAANTESWMPNKEVKVLVFGSHTETEKEVTDKDGKKKKVKEYTFTPVTAHASMTGVTGDPYARNLSMNGNILSSVRDLANISVEKGKAPKIEVHANVSRTVTEYLSGLGRREADAKDTIENLKTQEPKLKKVIETPWDKAAVMEAKTLEMGEVERLMAAHGQTAGKPEEGIEISRYQGQVPMMEDVAQIDQWYRNRNVVYPVAGDDYSVPMGISKDMELKDFTQGRRKIDPKSKYSTPDNLDVLLKESPADANQSDVVAYTTIDGDTRFWVAPTTEKEGHTLSVDPTEWQLINRMIGSSGLWRQVSHGNTPHLVHFDEQWKRDAFIKAKIESDVPSGVQKIITDTPAVKAEMPAKPAGEVHQYYAQVTGGNFDKVDGEDITIAPWLDNIFVYKSKDGWVVSEKTTGMRLSNYADTRESAINRATAAVETAGAVRVKQSIADGLQKNGGTPYYHSLPQYSRGKNESGQGLNRDALEQHAQQLMGNAKNKPELMVVEKASDLPFEALEDARGILYDGKMYLVAEQIATTEDANEVIFHEFVGHFGLRGFFGDTLNAVLDKIHVHNPRIRRYTNEWMKSNRDFQKQHNLSDLDYHYRAIEEAMARMAQENRPFGYARRLLHTVQTLLRKIGMTRLADMLEARSDAEALTMLHKAKLFINQGKTIGDNIPEPLYPYYMTAGYSARKVIHTPEFKKWFGNSKVVDENGDPLVVYKAMHPYDWTKETKDYSGPEITSINRSTEFPAFNHGEKGIKITGFFGSQEVANRFAEGAGQGQSIYPAYLSFKNPYIINASGKNAADVQFGETGRPFRDAVRSGKYDSVIIKDTKDEATIYVALNPTQIKSATGNVGTFDETNPDIRYSRVQADPPVSKDPKVLNLYLKDETDAIVKTIMNKLHPKHMNWLETMLKSPEWFSSPQIKNIVRLFMRDRNELYHETFNDLNMTDDINAPESTVTEAAKALKNKGLTIADRIAGKVSPEYQRLKEIIDEGDTAWKRDKSKPLAEQLEKFEEHVRQHGATEDTIRVWKLYRQSYDKALDLQLAQLKQMIEQLTEEANFRGEKPDLDELNQTLKGALAQMEEWRGFYAPRLREQGGWKVQAYREHGPMNENREWYREHRGSELAAQRLANKLKREGWTIHNIGEVERIPETIYQDVNAVATAKLIDAALEKVSQKSDLSNELTIKFNEEVLREVSNAIKARGFRSTMIHRGESVIRGFIEDPISRHIQYINSLAGGISKAKVARMAMKELMGEKVQGKQVGGINPIDQPKEFQVAQDYIQEQLRNVEQVDRIIGIAKSVATFKFLGFNIRSLAVNMTAIVTTAPAAIHQYVMSGKGSISQIIKELAVAGKDYGTVMAGKKLANADEQAFLDDLHKKGWDDAQYTREALGEISKTHSRIWSSMMDGSMYLFGKSERWNRGTTMLAAYRLARKQGMDHIGASEAAKDASDKAHGVYGKSTMPMWAQGSNPAAKVGQMMYVYGKFSHNYLQMLYDMGLKKHNIKGAMFAFLSPLVIAGGAALPFKGVLFGIAAVILRALGEDRDPEKWVWDIIRKHLGAEAEIAGRHGITGAMGVDISGSLSIGVGVPKGLMDLSGAIGGVANEFIEAGESLKNKQYSKAAEHLLPTGLANPIRAAREATEGVSTKNNRRVWDDQGRPYVPDKGSTAARVLGFRSAKQAVLSERTWEGHRQQADFSKKRDAIYEKYRAFLLSPTDRSAYNEIVRAVQDYNRQAVGVPGVSPITNKSLRTQVKRMMQPTRRERELLRS